MNTYEINQKLYACFLDMRRAAVSFYKVPDGPAHKEFLIHSLKILDIMKDKKLNKFKKEIINLQELTSNKKFSKKERMNIADDILTTGILLKSH